MSFEVAESTLESLEWALVTDALRACCRTPLGLRLIPEASKGARFVQTLFEQSDDRVRTRLAETSEARALLDGDYPPPLGSCADIASPLASAEKGGVLEASELIDIRRSLEAMHATVQFFDRRQEESPRLSDLARRIETAPELEAQITLCLDPSGEVRDSASSTLAKARRDVQRLSGDLQSRIERSLSHADIKPHLSDQYYTVRNGRFVLPVKADAKGHVHGIVHDASRSGTTLFIEPDGMVELNNRHRQAELTVDREILRIMRDLSAAVGRDAARLRDGLEWMALLDLAVARGQLSRNMDAVEPEVGREGIFELPGLRHPLIPPDECIANDLRLGRDFAVLLLSGPNAGGKTVALKSIALAALMVRAGLHVPADIGARVDLVDRVLADIGDHQDILESLSTFSAAMANLAEILRCAGPNTLICLDEIGVGTDPSEGAAIAQSTLEALADIDARVVTTTHYNLLKEMAEVDSRFTNASVEIDAVTFAPTYRVRIGAPGASSATTVAARMGMPQGVLDRTAALLDREDRQLDRMLSELGATRATLESEQTAARALRLESEQIRDEYRSKLARLQERRDKLFGEMRDELDRSFRGAHSEVARVIAELQRSPSSRLAAQAREKLEALHEKTEQVQIDQGLERKPSPGEPELAPIDWPQAKVGDNVRTPGGGTGRLLSLSDRKGRVSVQIAGAKISLSRDQLSAPESSPDQKARAESSPAAAEPMALPPMRLGGIVEVHLRGLRAEEALDRLDEFLDRAAAEGRDEIRVVHGIGTGALRSAVREHLPRSPYVIEWLEAPREDGGAGATRAILRKD
jgi:DNA mismatch repair protein MutS2